MQSVFNFSYGFSDIISRYWYAQYRYVITMYGSLNRERGQV
jgi:hypothetical protein